MRSANAWPLLRPLEKFNTASVRLIGTTSGHAEVISPLGLSTEIAENTCFKMAMFTELSLTRMRLLPVMLSSSALTLLPLMIWVVFRSNRPVKKLSSGMSAPREVVSTLFSSLVMASCAGRFRLFRRRASSRLPP